MSMTTQEQRRAPRIVFISSAIISYEHGQVMEIKVDTRNVSITGLYLETDKRIPVETLCKITIQLAGATSKMAFRAQGVVCRHDQTGMGIAFTQLDPDSYIHISNLVKLHAAENQ